MSRSATCLLAQAVTDIPLSDAMKTLVGLIGVMLLGITILTFFLLVKRVFGRTPPLDMEFKKLRTELYETSNRVKKEVGKDISELSNRTNEIENEIEEIKVDRERKWQELRTEYHQLDNKLTRLDERIIQALKHLNRDNGID
jgi:hypothetical protein